MAASDPRAWGPTRRALGTVLVLLAIAWLVVAMRDLIAPVAVASLLAYILHPLVELASHRLRLTRDRAVGLVFFSFLGTVVLAVIALAPIAYGQIRALGELWPIVSGQLVENLAMPPEILGFQFSLETLLTDSESLLTRFLEPARLLLVLQITSNTLLWLILIPVTTFHLLRDWASLREWFFAIFLPEFQPDVRRLYTEIKKVWAAYLRGQLVLMLLIGLLTTVGMVAVGLPDAVAVGILAGVLDLIPSVGPALAMVIGVLIAFFQGTTLLDLSNGWYAVLVLAIFLIIQSAENIWLRPRIIGHQVRLHPALVFAAIVISLTLFNILVTLFIVPLIGTTMILARYVRARLLHQDPWPDVRETSEQLLEA